MEKDKLFAEFVGFLFPNEKLEQDVIEAIVNDEIESYLSQHKLEYGAKLAAYHLKTIFQEMDNEDPDEEVIDNCLDEAMELLGTWTSPNLEGLKFFRQFDIESSARE